MDKERNYIPETQRKGSEKRRVETLESQTCHRQNIKYRLIHKQISINILFGDLVGFSGKRFGHGDSVLGSWKVRDGLLVCLSVMLFEHWFSVGVTCVKWGSIVSRFIGLLSGIRQGGVLSPHFLQYISIVLSRKLETVILVAIWNISVWVSFCMLMTFC